MDKQQLVNLCSRSWALTALALMARGVSGRVSPLAASAGCGRTAMGASVEHLIHLGLLERNPGHGHPLRPEYRFTAQGADIADWSLALNGLMSSAGEKAILRNKWSLPLISCIPGKTRYSDIRRQLVPVTDRALSTGLTKLSDISWIERTVSAERAPLVVTYETLDQGEKVHDHLLRLPKVA